MSATAMPPRIDVLLATYNGARYLACQLDSILAQTHTHLRILISDDGSTDDTPAVIDHYVQRHPGVVQRLPNPQPGGSVVANFAHLMAASLQSGEAAYIAFSDQDDQWLPEKLARSLAVLQQLEQAVGPHTPCLVHTDLIVVDAQLQVLAPSFVRYQRMAPAACSALHMLSINQVTGCTMLVNRAHLALAVPVPSGVVMHDWWCALISGSGQRQFIDEPLMRYRQHGHNQVGAKSRSLVNRLQRFATDATGVWRRVQRLGRATWAQAQALRARLQQSGLDTGDVQRYLDWRAQPLWRRCLGYRHYYVGPELDRLSRCLIWKQGDPAGDRHAN